MTTICTAFYESYLSIRLMPLSYAGEDQRFQQAGGEGGGGEEGADEEGLLSRQAQQVPGLRVPRQGEQGHRVAQVYEPWISGLFYSILFYSILFYSILF
jgi:hypothetical protein